MILAAMAIADTSPSLPGEHLRRVQTVTDAALAHLTVESLLDELLTRIRELLSADTAAVLLLDESNSELVATAAKGIEEEVEQGVRLPVGAASPAGSRQPESRSCWRRWTTERCSTHCSCDEASIRCSACR